MLFDYQEMFDFIADIAYDDDLDSNITDVLKVEFRDFENGYYNYNDLETAITGNQEEIFLALADGDDEYIDPEEEFKKHLKKFNKLKREFIFETVSRMYFLYGMACAADILRKDKK